MCSEGSKCTDSPNFPSPDDPVRAPVSLHLTGWIQMQPYIRSQIHTERTGRRTIAVGSLNAHGENPDKIQCVMSAILAGLEEGLLVEIAKSKHNVGL